MSSQIETLIAQMAADLAAVRADLAALRATLTPNAPVLAAIHAAIGDKAFTASDIVRYINAYGAENLRAVLLAAGAENARQLGRLFARLEGRGLRRVGHEKDGVVWQIVIAATSQPSA
jgi:hypothetical protein